MTPNNPGNDPTNPMNPMTPMNPADPNNPNNPYNSPSYPQQPPQYQPPVYNQQAPTPPTGQPQYPQQPQQPQQQKKKSNRGLIIGCGIALVVMLLVCGGVGVALYIGAQRAKDAVANAGNSVTASAQIELLCGDYSTQTYGSAYQLFSAAEQARMSQSQFVTRAEALDTSDGDVVTCTIDPNHTLPDISGDGKTATARVQVARGDNGNLVTGTVTLVFEDNQWKVDSADPALKLF